MRHSRGFTLVELMIVVAIIGILAAIGIPAYQDYLARGQMTEAVELLGGGKTPMAEYFGAHAQWPTAASSVMPVTSGRYVSQILMDHPGGTMRDLTLTAVMKGAGSSINPNLAGRTLLLTTADGGANWNCTKGTVPSQYLPGSCK